MNTAKYLEGHQENQNEIIAQKSILNETRRKMNKFEYYISEKIKSSQKCLNATEKRWRLPK